MSAYTNLLYHFVFSTKNRRPLIQPELSNELYPYIGGILRNLRCVLLDRGGMPDHIHLIVKARPDISVSELIRYIKSNSSKWVNEHPRWRRFEWQRKYGAFTESESELPGLRAYVRNQKEHHRQETFQEEFIRLLREHSIEYDERYLWD